MATWCALELPQFRAGLGFMNQVALIAQAMDHHPNWSNVYGSVTIQLNTHDLGGSPTSTSPWPNASTNWTKPASMVGWNNARGGAVVTSHP